MTGIVPDEAIGKDLTILFPEESRDASIDLIRRAMDGETWDVVEIPIQHRSGEVRTVLWNSANIRGSDGKTIIATIAQGQDITDRKKAELALLQKTEELHQKNEELAASEEELRHSLEEMTVQELAIRKKTKELEERYRFEELVRQIVSRFIRTDDFDQNIRASLADIGTYCVASRSYIFELRNNREVMDNTYEWCAENVSPEINNLQNLSTTLFP